MLRALAGDPGRIHDPRTQAHTRTSLGEAWRLQGEAARARASFAAAIQFSRSADERLGEAAALTAWARVQASSVISTTRPEHRPCAGAGESLRSELGGRDLRTSYLASVTGTTRLNSTC